jgi:membrane-associated PAP2 superfamily phosphatase
LKIYPAKTFSLILFFSFPLLAFTNGLEENVNSDSVYITADTLQVNKNDSNFVGGKNLNSNNEISNDSVIIHSNYLPEWYEMITNIPGDWWQFVKDQYYSPDYSMYLFLTVSTAGLIANDGDTYKMSDKFFKQNQVHRNISDLFAEVGDGRTQFGLAACFAIYGFASDNHRALRTASQIIEGVLAAGAVVQLFKHITGRESPLVSTSPSGKWRFFPNQIEYHKKVPHYDAFPSGHIATSVAAFVIIAENYPEYRSWITPISIGLSTLICVGMVNNGIHWYSDYPLGIAIGYAFGKLISNPKRIIINEKLKSKETLNILPYFNHQSYGISFNMSF